MSNQLKADFRAFASEVERTTGTGFTAHEAIRFATSRPYDCADVLGRLHDDDQKPIDDAHSPARLSRLVLAWWRDASRPRTLPAADRIAVFLRAIPLESAVEIRALLASRGVHVGSEVDVSDAVEASVLHEVVRRDHGHSPLAATGPSSCSLQ